VNDASYWTETLSKSDVSSLKSEVGQLPAQVDVAVIGGGYTGLAAARRLAMSGASVLVLERGDLGSGASSRSGGQVLTGLKLDVATLVAAYGERRARELFELGGRAIEDLEAAIAAESIDCDYERGGHIAAAAKPSHFEALRAEQALLARTFDHRVELVSRSEQRRELGSDAYHGLSIDQGSRAINPAKYVAGLAAAARRRGACLASGAAVTALRADAGGWRVTTRGSEVIARDVLVATNGYTGAIAPALQRRLIPIGSYVVVTDPLTDDEAAAILPARRVVFDTKHFLFYFRLTADNRLLFGGRAEFGQPTHESTRRAAAVLRRGIASVFPELSSTPLAFAWSGNVAFTRDQMPHAGRIDGVHYAAGYCGHGIAMATHLGDAIARRMLGDSARHPLMDDPMPAIPLYRGRPWFLPFVGAYYKVMDWLT
jgi:glycine/D-amino acid oxidase-like deaminating enzyme